MTFNGLTLLAAFAVYASVFLAVLVFRWSRQDRERREHRLVKRNLRRACGYRA
jgi:hypothetical protein